MTATWVRGLGISSTTIIPAAAIVARFASGVSVRAMPITAWATTATAAAINP